MSLNSYLALAGIVAVLGGAAWHKHVVHQRDDAQAQVVELTAKLKVANAAVKSSEDLRSAEATQAEIAIQAVRDDVDARVAEARRSAGAIKKIVEKPHAKIDPITSCPVPELVPAGELRDALQPNPFGEAPAAEPGNVPVAEAGTPPARDGGDSASIHLIGGSGDLGLPQLGSGYAGLGPDTGESPGEGGTVPGL